MFKSHAIPAGPYVEGCSWTPESFTQARHALKLDDLLKNFEISDRD
jgi:NADH:ubiquinone oxidoreductase subunit B-like Fe-S oxidoreductase